MQQRVIVGSSDSSVAVEGFRRTIIQSGFVTSQMRHSA
jgi:hypothetical protein